MLPGLFDHIFFIVVAVVMPAVAISQGPKLPDDLEWTNQTKVQLYFSNSIVLWIGVTIVTGLWFYNDRDFSILGLQAPRNSSIAIYLACLLVGLYIVDSLWKYLPANRSQSIAEMQKAAPFLPATKTEFSQYLVLAFSAAICEEFVFRGFMINYIQSIIGQESWAVALSILIPSIAFSLGHLYQGYKALVRIFVGTILFCLIFHFSGSLLIPIVIHLVIDVAGGMIATKFIEPKFGD